MKKIFKSKNIIYNIILIILALLLMLLMTRDNHIYGSDIDWLRQHVSFPEYFRNLFYNNHNLLPNFSFNLAGGQNIFYFAYYGLLSPIILLSYILPFIKMEDYIIISSCLIVIISTIMFYYLLIKDKYTKETSLFISILFLLSNGFLFHSHRHIMFMNYMPFLILGLFGVNNYINKKKSLLLIISIALMIITSYYFSVIGLVTIFLYYIYKIDNFNIKEICLFVLRMLIGIFLASFFLLPTIYVVKNGRNSEEINILLKYFIPQVNSKFLLYDAYGIGSVSIIWISLIYNIIFKKKNIRLVSILLFVLIIFPIINLLLNGGLYLNGKVFIPLTPLFLILTANMINYIRNNKTSLIWLNISILISIIFIKFNSLTLYILIDIFITLILLNLYSIYKKKYILLPIVLIALSSSIIINNNDKLLLKDDLNSRRNIINLNVSKYFDKENYKYRYHEDTANSNLINYSYAKDDYRSTIYSSTSNISYINTFNNYFNNNDRYRNLLMVNQTNNIFFDRFMGIKYLLKKDNIPYGYKKIKEFKDLTLYKNNNTYPIAFSKTNLLSLNDYNKLKLNEKLEAFNNNIITTNITSNPNLNFISKKVNLEHTISKINNITISKENNKYIINSTNSGKLVLDLNKPIINKTLIIRFRMNKTNSCPNDSIISINGIKNVLTCSEWKYFSNNYNFDYVVNSNEEINNLDIKFKKGTYVISDILIYEIDNSFFSNNDIIPLKTDNNSYKDNSIHGTINQLEDGYFIFTIPYDKGFSIYLDNKKISYEKVNNGFIGFPINKGYHDIKLVFEAPYYKEGKIISIITLVSLIPLSIYEKKKNKVN